MKGALNAQIRNVCDYPQPIVTDLHDYESNPVFLRVTLLPLFWENEYRVKCRAKGCSEEAAYVYARIVRTDNYETATRWLIHSSWVNSSWCEKHFRQRRKNLAVIGAREEVIAILKRLRDNYNRRERESRQEHADRRARTMGSDGRVLEMTGTQGRLFETPTGWEFSPYDGPPQPCCCRPHGSYLVRSLSRGRPITPSDRHADNCDSA